MKGIIFACGILFLLSGDIRSDTWTGCAIIRENAGITKEYISCESNTDSSQENTGYEDTGYGDIGYGDTEEAQDAEEVMRELLQSYDFSELDKQLDQVEGMQSTSFEELLDQLLQGDVSVNSDNVNDFTSMLYQIFLAELNANKTVMIKLLGLAILAALFTNLGGDAAHRAVGENGFYITYLVMLVLLLAAYHTMYQLAYETFEDVLNFMYALVPVYMAAVGYCSGITSAAVLEDSLILGMSVISRAVKMVIFPVIHLYMALGLMDNLMEREFVTKLTDLLETSVKWLLKTILALMVGLNTVKSMLAPNVDSMTATALRRGLQVIPGGDTASMMSGVVIGSGVLIKNAIGVGGICVLTVAVSVPVLKIAAIIFLYKLMSALLQPVADRRLIRGLRTVEQSGQMMIASLLAEIALFFLSIAIIASHTNVNYYAG